MKRLSSALWKNSGSAAEGLSAAEPACGGKPLAAEPCPRKWTFGSGREFRPPKVPPNMHEFRLWREPSAAESAAEGA